MSTFRLKKGPHTTVKVGSEEILVARDGEITVPDTRDAQFQAPTWEKIIKKDDNIKKESKKKSKKKDGD